MTYNYKQFDTKHYNLMSFPGPQLGSVAEDFTLFDLSGAEVKLSDFSDSWLVLETGSITCNMYTLNISKMNKLREKYPEVESILVYVREAHPGSKLPQHSSLGNKVSFAAKLGSTRDEGRKILVDDMEGSMHRKYGAMPNFVYVINPAGEVVYRHNWANAEELDLVLENRDVRYANEHASTWELKPFGFKTNIEMFKTVGRAGWDAIWDLVKFIPAVVWMHVKADLKAMKSKSEA